MRVLFSDDHLLNLLKQLVAAVFKIDHIPDSSFPAKCSKKLTVRHKLQRTVRA